MRKPIRTQERLERYIAMARDMHYLVLTQQPSNEELDRYFRSNGYGTIFYDVKSWLVDLGACLHCINGRNMYLQPFNLETAINKFKAETIIKDHRRTEQQKPKISTRKLNEAHRTVKNYGGRRYGLFDVVPHDYLRAITLIKSAS